MKSWHGQRIISFLTAEGAIIMDYWHVSSIPPFLLERDLHSRAFKEKVQLLCGAVKVFMAFFKTVTVFRLARWSLLILDSFDLSQQTYTSLGTCCYAYCKRVSAGVFLL